MSEEQTDEILSAEEIDRREDIVSIYRDKVLGPVLSHQDKFFCDVTAPAVFHHVNQGEINLISPRVPASFEEFNYQTWSFAVYYAWLIAVNTGVIIEDRPSDSERYHDALFASNCFVSLNKQNLVDKLGVSEEELKNSSFSVEKALMSQSAGVTPFLSESFDAGDKITGMTEYDRDSMLKKLATQFAAADRVCLRAVAVMNVTTTIVPTLHLLLQDKIVTLDDSYVVSAGNLQVRRCFVDFSTSWNFDNDSNGALYFSKRFVMAIQHTLGKMVFYGDPDNFADRNNVAYGFAYEATASWHALGSLVPAFGYKRYGV